MSKAKECTHVNSTTTEIVSWPILMTIVGARNLYYHWEEDGEPLDLSPTRPTFVCAQVLQVNKFTNLRLFRSSYSSERFSPSSGHNLTAARSSEHDCEYQSIAQRTRDPVLVEKNLPAFLHIATPEKGISSFNFIQPLTFHVRFHKVGELYATLQRGLSRRWR